MQKTHAVVIGELVSCYFTGTTLKLTTGLFQKLVGARSCGDESIQPYKTDRIHSHSLTHSLTIYLTNQNDSLTDPSGCSQSDDIVMLEINSSLMILTTF